MSPTPAGAARTPSKLKVAGAASTRPGAVAARRRVLAGIILGIVLLDVAAVWLVQRRLEAAIRQRVASVMRTALDNDTAAVTHWFDARLKLLGGIPDEKEFAAAAERLLADPSDAEARAALSGVEAAMALGFGRYVRFALIDAKGNVVFDQSGNELGAQLDPISLARLALVDPPKARVLLPFKDARGEVRGLGVSPLMKDGALQGWVVVPIPLSEFLAGPFAGRRLMETGEVYAFTREGLMLSESRFPGALRQAGLLPPDSESTVLALALRDPGADLTKGHQPVGPLGAQPLTKLAAAAAVGQDGEDLEGYRDYRGVPVWGVWRWLGDYGFGLGIEVDAEEALAPMRLLRPLAAGFLVAVGGLLAVAVWLFLRVRDAERRARVLKDEAERLGQYELVRKLGEGGMGVVYEARHEFLHRPVAIKVMQPGAFTPEQAARFEREVQVTASLAHPNTVSVYDYGRGADGSFYYVMELLTGSDLEDLVLRTGPMPGPRVAHLLRQICGSLAEAHQRGLVHRDIKPANIHVSARPGVHDVVKLLDFGLVRIEDAKGAGLTQSRMIMGTPLYMAPECFEGAQLASAASDIYAVGAVAYFMVTGSHVFDPTRSYVDLMMDHRGRFPEPPAEALGHAVDPALERFISACLAKRASERPASMSALLTLLAEVRGTWTEADAEAWWDKNRASIVGAATEPATPVG